MRHQKAGRKLKRTASHRRATLANLSCSLILHKRIRTTVAKAKETRSFVEKLITRAKRAIVRETESSQKDVAARREVFAVLHNRSAVTELFKEIAPKVLNRAGGYTRVVKLGRRPGDGAELAMLELVDFNIAEASAKSKKKSTEKVQTTSTAATASVPTTQQSEPSSGEQSKASQSDSDSTKKDSE